MISRFQRAFLPLLYLASITSTNHARSPAAGAIFLRSEAAVPVNLKEDPEIRSTIHDSNVTTSAASNDVAGLTVGYFPQRLADLSIEEIALGFINALKLQGLEDAAESQTMYNFEDTEYPDGKISISMEAVHGASSAKTIRSSVMNALAVLPVNLMEDNHLAGVEFYETYRRRYLYRGILNDISDHHRSELSSSNASAAATSEKRSSHPYQLTVQDLNATTICLTIPGDDRPKLEIAFHLIGLPLSRVGFFSTIMMMMNGVGLREATDEIDVVQMSDRGMPAWIFVRKIPGTRFELAVYHVLALLEGIARYSAQQGSYRELVYDLFADGELISGGCVTQPIERRRWCAGLWGEGRHGIVEGSFPAYDAP